MKKQNLESVTNQLDQELHQTKQELQAERQVREESERTVYTLEKELNQALADLEFTQAVIRDRESVIAQMQAVNHDNLSRIGTFAHMQIQKVRQEQELLRAQFVNEIELSFKHVQNLIHQI